MTADHQTADDRARRALVAHALASYSILPPRAQKRPTAQLLAQVADALADAQVEIARLRAENAKPTTKEM